MIVGSLIVERASNLPNLSTSIRLVVHHCVSVDQSVLAFFVRTSYHVKERGEIL